MKPIIERYLYNTIYARNSNHHHHGFLPNIIQGNVVFSGKQGGRLPITISIPVIMLKRKPTICRSYLTDTMIQFSIE